MTGREETDQLSQNDAIRIGKGYFASRLEEIYRAKRLYGHTVDHRFQSQSLTVAGSLAFSLSGRSKGDKGFFSILFQIIDSFRYSEYFIIVDDLTAIAILHHVNVNLLLTD